ncbi:MAG: aminotransferase class I/II-fold pyridoxal phosphate-dependent enzyme [Planctomycetota bacterium]|nr:aminotransferase class I/II-fold pyridoxal phosphate-dependent enzyme [Planctomycetota bacterium]
MLAKRMSKIEASGIRKIFDLVQHMKDPIDLSIGQADFDVPKRVKEAAVRAINEGHNRYTITQGLPELREKLRIKLKGQYGIEPESLFITAGAAGGIFLSYMALLDPGDEILVFDPYFVMYKHLANVIGAVPKYVDTYPDFRPSKERILKAITKKTKVIMVNSPVNPTGIAYTAEEMRMIADIAEAHKLLIISDEIYDHFVYDRPHECMMKYYPKKTILVGGFSKTYGMPGWRIGYVAGPQEILHKMETLQQFTFVCANAPAQRGCAEAFDVDMSPHIEEFRKRRELVYGMLKPHFDCVRPEGAFYIFPRVPGGTGQEFSKRAIEKDVLIVPGNACSDSDTHFRLSYAAPDAKLRRGIEILIELAKKK